MSGNGALALEERKKSDRRVARTQSLVLEAFRDLLLERGYDGFTVRDLIDGADIGRSTFYEHFENKDDVFERSVAHPMGALADGLFRTTPDDGLRSIVEHFWENRVLARAVFGGPARFVLERVLSGMIAARLEERVVAAPRGAQAQLPRELIAAQIAAAQIALVAAWVEAKAPCDAATLARALHASTHAMLGALAVTRGS